MGEPIGAIGDKTTSRTDAWLKKPLIQPKTENAEGGGLTAKFTPDGGTFLDAVASLHTTESRSNSGTW